MNNYRLSTADRLTHIKIVMVSLIAGAVVVCVGKAGRRELPDMNTRIGIRSPALMADRPVVWTSADQITIR